LISRQKEQQPQRNHEESHNTYYNSFDPAHVFCSFLCFILLVYYMGVFAQNSTSSEVGSVNLARIGRVSVRWVKGILSGIAHFWSVNEHIKTD
jgi:hypothetical protein